METDSPDRDTTEQPLRWFALCVKPRHDKTVGHLLRVKGYREVVPLYRKRQRYGRTVKQVLLPLFPGYVFCQLDEKHIRPVLETPGVIDIVRAGKKPVPIHDREILAIQQAIGSELPVQPCQWMEVGQEVTFTDGPLRGITGLLVSIENSEQLVLSISLLRRSITVAVDRSWIGPARPVPGKQRQT